MFLFVGLACENDEEIEDWEEYYDQFELSREERKRRAEIVDQERQMWEEYEAERARNCLTTILTADSAMDDTVDHVESQSNRR